MTAYVGNEGKVSIKTLHHEETIDKGIEKTLVKLLSIRPPFTYTLREENSHSTPGDLIWGEVGSTLQIRGMEMQRIPLINGYTKILKES